MTADTAAISGRTLSDELAAEWRPEGWHADLDSRRAVAGLLRAAADRIESVGWHQGSMVDHSSGAICATQALHWAVIRSRVTLPDRRVLYALFEEIWIHLAEEMGACFKEEMGAYLKEKMGAYAVKQRPQGSHVACWNDAPWQTAFEVIAAMRETAQKLDPLPSPPTPKDTP